MFPNGSSVELQRRPRRRRHQLEHDRRPTREFVHALNRHDFWQDLSQAYVLTGDAKYVNELISQLSSWSTAEPRARRIRTRGRPTIRRGSRWMSRFRADNWTWAYQHVLGSSRLDGRCEHAVPLQALPARRFPAPRHAVRADEQPLAVRGVRACWRSRSSCRSSTTPPTGRPTAATCSSARWTAQLNADGGHAESSPGLCRAASSTRCWRRTGSIRRRASRRRGPATRLDKLENAAEGVRAAALARRQARRRCRTRIADVRHVLARAAASS